MSLMKSLRLVAALLLLSGAAGMSAQSVTPAVGATSAPFWSGMSDAASFERAMDARLAHARDMLARLTATKAPPTIDHTLRPYDDVALELDAVSSQAGLIQAVHPDEAVRQTAERISQNASALATELSLNRGVYDAINGLDVSRADPETKYYVQRTLRDFRLAGVDKDEATRKRIQQLRDELVLVGQDFDRNIRTDLRTVTAKSATDLAGLPADFVARHKPEADGTISLTIDYPDSLPVFSYAKNEDLRKRMYMEYNNRAHPANMAVLDKMLARRAELARLVGYSNWADYITANKMVGSAKNASDFIDRIVAASGPKAEREYAALVKRKAQDVPGATIVNAWESTYYAEL